MRKPKIQTMKELSKAIGISRPTLARYFEDETSVLPSTAQKIMAGLETVDYVYNFLATRQNRKSTGLIGVVIPHFEDLFFASLLDSIEVAARAAGFTIITQSAHGEHATEDRALRKLRSMNVDGAIVAPLGGGENAEALLAASQDFPIVFADSRPPAVVKNADFVGTDNLNSIGIMVDYLCRTGKPPVFLTMPGLNSNAREREQAYLTQMKYCGFEGEILRAEERVQPWQFERYGVEVMENFFGRGLYVDATILCANDRIAIGAIKAANTHGLFARHSEACGGFRIAGHDDHPLSRYISPAVTTVAQEVAGIGCDAVELLMRRIQDGQCGDAVTRLRKGALRIRESA